MKRAAPIFAVVALLGGCFPDFSDLTGAPPDDASSEDVRVSFDADAAADCTRCDAVAEPTFDAPPDVPADVPADVFVDEPSPDVTIDACRRDGGTPGIRITSSSGDFCIDKTEVSNGDYAKFLLAQPDGGPPNQPSYCSWNSKLTPNDPSWPQPGLDDFPVANVDWCDAYAYCKWAGKRLCGRIGGGPVADIRATDPTQSQWYLACAGSNSSMYPYADTYDPHACNGVENMSPPQLLEVGKMSTCEGRARGLFDMSGNVYEWVDSCEANIGSNDYCRMMGGGYTSPSYELACSYRATNTRDHFLPNAGFRCCTDL
jgi:formylglycine-generating enzyme required for sulfatase activity